MKKLKRGKRMRSLLVALLLICAIAAVGSAEMLVTANPIGQGKWAVLGAGYQDSNAYNNSGWKTLTIGGYAGYGITNKLDVLAQIGQANVSGLPAGVSVSSLGYGLILKYAVLEEGASMPVSVSAGAGYKLLNNKVTGLADATGNQWLVGLGVSKMMVPFIPYGGVTYRNTNAGFAGGVLDSAQLDITLGTAIAWSTQGAVFVEYTLQSVNPSTASGIANHSSGQIGLGVGYKI
ncbi:MAG: hypothetical protein PHG97_04640 [Candidatus Margulisbacteria bacterium]|nr:hypothetical protein [Candidatus Margulisiibacteriota bacterium]